jgi:hypothetical protein
MLLCVIMLNYCCYVMNELLFMFICMSLHCYVVCIN